MSKPIVVVGSINLDLVATADRIPQIGETIHGHSFHSYFGGKGANQAVAASRLGADVAMIGKVGSDEFGIQLKEGLNLVGVNADAVSQSAGSSGIALITTDQQARNSIVVVAGANGELRPEDLDRHRAKIEAAAVVLTQLEIPLPTIEHLASLVSRANVPLILDPGPAQPLSEKIMRAVTWLTPNETESAALLTENGGDMNPPETARRLLALGCRNVALKLGPAGVYLSGRDTASTYVNAFRVRAMDTTAAGDAWNGAFAVGLNRYQSPEKSACFACAAAAISVTRAGAQPSMPTLQETEEFLAANLKK